MKGLFFFLVSNNLKAEKICKQISAYQVMKTAIINIILGSCEHFHLKHSTQLPPEREHWVLYSNSALCWFWAALAAGCRVSTSGLGGAAVGTEGGVASSEFGWVVMASISCGEKWPKGMYEQHTKDLTLTWTVHTTNNGLAWRSIYDLSFPLSTTYCAVKLLI